MDEEDIETELTRQLVTKGFPPPPLSRVATRYYARQGTDIIEASGVVSADGKVLHWWWTRDGGWEVPTLPTQGPERTTEEFRVPLPPQTPPTPPPVPPPPYGATPRPSRWAAFRRKVGF